MWFTLGLQECKHQLSERQMCRRQSKKINGVLRAAAFKPPHASIMVITTAAGGFHIQHKLLSTVQMTEHPKSATRHLNLWIMRDYIQSNLFMHTQPNHHWFNHRGGDTHTQRIIKYRCMRRPRASSTSTSANQTSLSRVWRHPIAPFSHRFGLSASLLLFCLPDSIFVVL